MSILSARSPQLRILNNRQRPKNAGSGSSPLTVFVSTQPPKRGQFGFVFRILEWSRINPRESSAFTAEKVPKPILVGLGSDDRVRIRGSGQDRPHNLPLAKNYCSRDGLKIFLPDLGRQHESHFDPSPWFDGSFRFEEHSRAADVFRSAFAPVILTRSTKPQRDANLDSWRALIVPLIFVPCAFRHSLVT